MQGLVPGERRNAQGRVNMAARTEQGLRLKTGVGGGERKRLVRQGQKGEGAKLEGARMEGTVLLEGIA